MVCSVCHRFMPSEKKKKTVNFWFRWCCSQMKKTEVKTHQSNQKKIQQIWPRNNINVKNNKKNKQQQQPTKQFNASNWCAENRNELELLLFCTSNTCIYLAKFNWLKFDHYYVNMRMPHAYFSMKLFSFSLALMHTPFSFRPRSILANECDHHTRSTLARALSITMGI